MIRNVTLLFLTTLFATHASANADLDATTTHKMILQDFNTFESYYINLNSLTSIFKAATKCIKASDYDFFLKSEVDEKQFYNPYVFAGADFQSIYQTSSSDFSHNSGGVYGLGFSLGQDSTEFALELSLHRNNHIEDFSQVTLSYQYSF